MKTLLTSALAGLVALMSSQAMALSDEPVVFNQLPSAMYVPVGFDTNDNSQIVIEGQFDNSCYRPGVTEYQVDYASKTILINNKAQKYQSDFCLMVILEYKKEINLGLLNVPGDYKVMFMDNSGQSESLGMINIAPASTSAADDYIYAPVREARYDKPTLDKNGEVVLRGTFTNSCMKMDRVIVSRPNVGVIQVLPIAKMEDRTDCRVLKDNPVPFEERISLKGFGSGRVLIHVRSLNGQAVNLIEWL